MVKKSPDRILECLEALLEGYQPYHARTALETAYEDVLKKAKGTLHYQWYSAYRELQEASKR